MKHKEHTKDIANTNNTAASDSPELEAVETDIAAIQKDYEELKQRLNSAEDSANEAQSLYQRMAADFENYRKRVDRERQEFSNFGIQRAAEALFPALDDLDRAQSGLNAQMKSEDILESIKIVFNRVRQALEQVGVQPIIGVGEHFDPQFHEPVQQIETEEFPDGTVAEVLRKGYTLNGKVIRPALVNVASNKTSDSEED
jgi:molecular chaperone GrpE